MKNVTSFIIDKVRKDTYGSLWLFVPNNCTCWDMQLKWFTKQNLKHQLLMTFKTDLCSVVSFSLHYVAGQSQPSLKQNYMLFIHFRIKSMTFDALVGRPFKLQMFACTVNEFHFSLVWIQMFYVQGWAKAVVLKRCIVYHLWWLKACLVVMVLVISAENQNNSNIWKFGYCDQ